MAQGSYAKHIGTIINNVVVTNRVSEQGYHILYLSAAYGEVSWACNYALHRISCAAIIRSERLVESA